jgi:hypothetical protein
VCFRNISQIRLQFILFRLIWVVVEVDILTAVGSGNMIVTYLTSFQPAKADGLNAVFDVGDTCNDGSTAAANDTACTQGYVDGYNTTCQIGVPKNGNEDGGCPEHDSFVGR